MIKNGKVLALLFMLILLCFAAGACGGKNNGNTTVTESSSENMSYSDQSVGASAVDSVSNTSFSFDFGTSPAVSTTAPSLIDYNTTTKKNTSAGTTKRQSGTTTTKKAANTTTTTKPVSEMSLKELQMLMFMTEDPTIAKQILTVAGFEYDPVQDIYYSSMNPLQRQFGFNTYYDAAAPLVGMIYDTERIYFSYDDKDWLVQIWKGQYGVTVGAEIGIYYKPSDRAVAQYDCVSDEDLIEMSMNLYKDDQLFFTRGPERHWWLTGFKLLRAAVPSELTLTFTLVFDDKNQAKAFGEAADKKKSDTFECYSLDGFFLINWK